MRLVDKILQERPRLPPWVRSPATELTVEPMALYLSEAIREATVILANNVTEYVYAGTDQERFLIKRDFPNLAPPFPLFWIETDRPSKIVSREFGTRAATYLPSQWGLLFEAFEQQEVRQFLQHPDWRPALLDQLKRSQFELWLRLGPAVLARADRVSPAQLWTHLTPQDWDLLRMARTIDFLETITMIKAAEHLDALRWVLLGSLFAELDNLPGGTARYGPLARWFILVDAEGQVVGEPYVTIPGLADLGDDLPEVARSVESFVWPGLLAISFMHCKNVQLVDERPPRAERRRQQRQGGPPLTTYKTLHIEPMRQVLRREGRADTVGLKQSLAICRGHFKTYRERGLFGKHTGTWWWPMHVRGSAEQGTVHKRYEMEPPQMGAKSGRRLTREVGGGPHA